MAYDYKDSTRFFWLEFLCFWLGGASAEEIGESLEVSRNHLQTAVLRRYRNLSELLPGRKGSKRLEIGNDRDAAEVADELKFCPADSRDVMDILLAEKVRSAAGCHPHVTIPVEDVRAQPETRSDALKTILTAIRRKMAVDITYLSKNGFVEGRFSPHSLVRTAGRVHCRGWWDKAGGGSNFSDMVLNRMVELSLCTGGYVGPQGDSAWHAYVSIHATLKEDLPAPIRNALIQENNGSDVFAARCRQALELYVRRNLLARRIEGIEGAVWEIGHSEVD